MSWNYRVIKHRTNTGNPKLDAASPCWFGLHEVHYDENGKIIGYSQDREAADTVRELFQTLQAQASAAARAVLNQEGSEVLDEDELPKDGEGN